MKKIIPFIFLLAACSKSAPTVTLNSPSTPVVVNNTVYDSIEFKPIDSIVLSNYSGTMSVVGLIQNKGVNKYNIVLSGPNWVNNQSTGFVLLNLDTNNLSKLTDVTNQLNQTYKPVHARRLVIKDLNGDGEDDFFVANQGFDQSPFSGELNSLFIQNSGSFTDKSNQLPQVQAFYHSAAIGDLKKNGNQDILVGVLGNTFNSSINPNYYGNNVANGSYIGSYILRNDGKGNFTYDNNSLPSLVSNSYSLFTSGKPVDTTFSGHFLASFFNDFNKDGYPDLLLTSDQYSRNSGIIYYNDKTGKFNDKDFTLLPPGLFGALNTIVPEAKIVDLNNDGLDDIILSETTTNPYYGTGKMQVLINKNGSFEDQTNSYFSDQALLNDKWFQYIHTVDLNGDNIPELFNSVDNYDLTKKIYYYVSKNGKYIKKELDPNKKIDLYVFKIGNSNFALGQDRVFTSPTSSYIRVFLYKLIYH
jgi:hypothetical protein